jgi:sugar phosphate permease
LVTVIGDISIRDHYPLSAAYMFGSLFITGGIVGAIVIGNQVQKTKNFSYTILSLVCLSCSILLGLLVFLKKDFEWFSGILFTALGFCLLPLYAISVDFGAELTFPLAQSFSTGIIVLFGQIFSVIYITSSTYYIQNDIKDGPNSCITLLGISMFVCLFFFVCLDEDL